MTLYNPNTGHRSYLVMSQSVIYQVQSLFI